MSAIKKRCWMALGVLWLWPVLAVEMPSAWRNVQTFEMQQTGLLKISVPLETLTAARAELEDLRLYESTPREVPYLMERPVSPKMGTRPPKNFHVTVNPDSTVIELQTMPAQSISGVTLESPSPDFLKAVKIEASMDQAAWNILGQGELIFRQPNGASRLRLPLSLNKEAGPFLRLTLDDRRTPAVPITGAQLHEDAEPAAPSEALGIEILKRDEEPGQTRLALRLAGTHCTLAGLTLLTADPLFTRSVTLSQQQFTNNEIRESIIFQGTVYRVALEGQQSLSELTFAKDVPVQSRDLLLTIRNEDNPPLTISGIEAARRPVYLTFLASQPGVYSLISGNTQCAKPRYDLALLAPRLKGVALTEIAPAALIRNPVFASSAEIVGLDSLGTSLDVAEWKFSKTIKLGPGSAQWAELDMDVLAHQNHGFQDVRLISSGKQVPYVLERTTQTRSVSTPMSAANDPKRPTVSRWKITLPQHPLPVTGFTFTVPASYFKRQVTLLEDVSDSRGNLSSRMLASAAWVRRPAQKENRIFLALSSPPATKSLTLEIENGDNPPLELNDPAAWIPVIRVLFAAPPESRIELFYGNSKARAPQYDLELAMPQLLAANKSMAELGLEKELKPERTFITQSAAGWIFWVILGAVVVLLLVVIAKLLPAPNSPVEGPKP